MVDGILRSRKVFIYGSGRSGLVGQLFAVRLVQLGLDVHFVGEMTTPIIGKEDLTLLISNTGRTSSVVQTARIARRIGSSVFCITGASGSPLTEVSDRSIVMDVSDGTEIRSFKAKAKKDDKAEEFPPAEEGKKEDKEPSAPSDAGFNRFVWNLRRADATKIATEGGDQPEGAFIRMIEFDTQKGDWTGRSLTFRLAEGAAAIGDFNMIDDRRALMRAVLSRLEPERRVLLTELLEEYVQALESTTGSPARYTAQAAPSSPRSLKFL